MEKLRNAYYILVIANLTGEEGTSVSGNLIELK
jgi:hypothetical protein